MKLSRREMLLSTAGAALAAGAAPGATYQSSQLKGRIKQSVARWCYSKLAIEELARGAAAIGLKGIDLIGPDDWPVAKKYGLIPTMTTGAGTIPDGMNRKDLHDKFEAEFRVNIPRAAAAGIPNVIVFSGNRRGMSDGEGIENCASILNRVKALAEEHRVTICMELLNSRVDHKDYQCDHTTWGVELVKRVNSPRFKLLYDIYHMQIMEGDVIRTIRDNFGHIAHYHTGGVPGRNEIDETQELYYPAIVRAIIDLGFSGYMAHEFIPKRDPLTSLREAALLCDL